jgi:hypothetical protein
LVSALLGTHSVTRCVAVFWGSIICELIKIIADNVEQGTVERCQFMGVSRTL